MGLCDNFNIIAPREVHKTELYDGRALRFLRKLDSLSDDDRRKLDKYYYSAKNDRRKVTYETYRGFGTDCVGRYGVRNEVGLQAFSKKVRGLLAQKYYWDLDICNCQPTLLLQLAQEKGWDCDTLRDYCENREERLASVCSELGIERDDAKEIFISILYGSSKWQQTEYLRTFTAQAKKIQQNILLSCPAFFDKVKKRRFILDGTSDIESSACAIYLQTIERQLLLVSEDFLRTQKREFLVYIHDGGLIKKERDETHAPTHLLPFLELHVKNQTGFSVRFAFKEFAIDFVIPPEEKIYRADELINDSFAASQLATLAGSDLGKSNGKLLVFDESTGVWTGEEEPLKRLVHKFEKQLIFKQEGSFGIITHDYGGCERNIPKMLSQALNYVEEIKLDYDTSIGKLLFANGIFDLQTQQFTDSFDPTIHFAGRIPRNFSAKRDTNIESLVKKILFEDPYLVEQREQAEFFMTGIARAIYGDYKAKRAYISVGEANCGRGLLTEALRLTYGSFVALFNSNNLLYNSRSSDDEAKKLKWYLPISQSRLAISNEISMTGQYVDSNTLKSLSSGGDEIIARKLHENEITVKSRTTCLLLTNDIPKMKPADQGLLNRLCVNELKKFYVANPDPMNPYQAKEDKTLKEKFAQESWQTALFWILSDCWVRFFKTDRIAPKPLAIQLAAEEWIETGTSVRSLLEQGFEITKVESDYVTGTTIRAFLKEKGCKYSDTKIGREIRKITGFDKDQKKIDGKNTKVYFGLKEPVSGSVSG